MTRMRIFWVLYVFLLGAAMLLKLVFGWEYSVWTAAFALLVAVSILSLLTGNFGAKRRRSVTGGGNRFFLTGDVTLPCDEPGAALCLCDATVLLTPPLNRLTTICCVLSDITVRLPQGWSVRTVCQTSLGKITAPESSLSGFDDRVIVIGDGLQAQMEIKCLLGSVTILD